MQEAHLTLLDREIHLLYGVGLATGSLRRELRRAPGTLEPAHELVAELVDRQPYLLERVPVAQRDRAVFERLAVDGDPPRSPDLVLPPVAASDRAAVVVLGRQPAAQILVDLAGKLGHAVAVHERQHGGLDRSELRVEAQHGALAILHLLLVVA